MAKEFKTVTLGDIRLEGYFENGRPVDRGTIFYADGSRYEGQWNIHGAHGKGILYDPQGRKKLEGGFANGECTGKGKWYIDGKLYYEGEWAKEADGKIKEGQSGILHQDGKRHKVHSDGEGNWVVDNQLGNDNPFSISNWGFWLAVIFAIVVAMIALKFFGVIGADRQKEEPQQEQVATPAEESTPAAPAERAADKPAKKQSPRQEKSAEPKEAEEAPAKPGGTGFRLERVDHVPGEPQTGAAQEQPQQGGQSGNGFRLERVSPQTAE